MGLLDKTNPEATLWTVLRAGVTGIVVGAVVFFAMFKAQYIASWRVALPIWLLMCAGVAALCQWQVPRDWNDDTKEK